MPSAMRQFVDRRLLAFYYGSKVECQLLAELQLANTPVVGGPILHQCNRPWKCERWISEKVPPVKGITSSSRLCTSNTEIGADGAQRPGVLHGKLSSA